MDVPTKPQSMSSKAYRQFKGHTNAEKKKSNNDTIEEKQKKKILLEAEESNLQIERMRLENQKKRTGSAEVSSAHEVHTEEKRELESDDCLIGETKVEINKTPELTAEHVKF